MTYDPNVRVRVEFTGRIADEAQHDRIEWASEDGKQRVIGIKPRRFVQPIADAEKKFDLEPGSLRRMFGSRGEA